MSTEKKNVIPAVFTAVSVMCITAASVIYFRNDKSSDNISVIRNETSVNETVSVSAPSETAAATAVTTDLSQTIVSATEPALDIYENKFINSVSYVFGKVNTESDSLNIRKTPSADGEIVGTLEKDSTVYIMGETDGWYEIEFIQHTEETAFVSADYIRVSTPEGTWQQKYHQIADDVYDYLEMYLNAWERGSLDFFLTDLNGDDAPEMIYEHRDIMGNGPKYIQCFSASDSGIIIDRRRYGESAEKFLTSDSELIIQSPCQGYVTNIISFSGDKFSQINLFRKDNSYNPNKIIDAYYIDGKSVSESEYQKTISEHTGIKSTDRYSYDEFISKLDSMS